MNRIIRSVPVIVGGLAIVFAFGAMQADQAAFSKALTFHASFDRTVDADFALGDRRLHTATSYSKREDAKPGLHHPDVNLVPQAGRYGGALKFAKKNTKAIYYPAEKNVGYQSSGWNGTVSFWLSLDPETDLEPGYCDPIQVTDQNYNDAAIWVDFTKDDRPRHFRLGVFGDLKVWNPQDIPPDKNPAFLGRLVVVKKTPFARGKWTHIAITHAELGSAKGGRARLYLDGALQASTPEIPEPFTWDMKRAAIRLGVNYVGLFDDLAVFDRELSSEEIKTLHQLKDGIRSLRQ